MFPILDLNKDGVTDATEMMRGWEEHKRTRARAQIVKASIEAVDKIGANGQKPGIHSDQILTREEKLWELRHESKEHINKFLKTVLDPESEEYVEHINESQWREYFEEQIKEKQDVAMKDFDAADRNMNGELDLEEQVDLFSKAGDRAQGVLAREAELAVKQKDQNGDGKVSVREFYAMQIQEQIEEGKGADVPKLLKDQFKQFDTDGDGLVNVQEFIAIADNRAMLVATCGQAIKWTGKDGKTVTKEEFSSLQSDRHFPIMFRNVVNWLMGEEDQDWGKKWVEGEEDDMEAEEEEGAQPEKEL